MDALSTTSSMRDWFTEDWVITTGLAVGYIEAPPPPRSDTLQLLQEWQGWTNKEMSGYAFDDEEVQEHIQDLAIAEDALAGYLANGTLDTRPYSEYRANRLDSAS